MERFRFNKLIQLDYLAILDLMEIHYIQLIQARRVMYMKEEK